jgi:hypothetical protein
MSSVTGIGWRLTGATGKLDLKAEMCEGGIGVLSSVDAGISSKWGECWLTVLLGGSISLYCELSVVVKVHHISSL